jgi:hypothetical protein
MQALDLQGIPGTTFYRWYDRYDEDGSGTLADRSICPTSVWNRVPQVWRDDLVGCTLEAVGHLAAQRKKRRQFNYEGVGHEAGIWKQNSLGVQKRRSAAQPNPVSQESAKKLICAVSLGFLGWYF